MATFYGVRSAGLENRRVGDFNNAVYGAGATYCVSDHFYAPAATTAADSVIQCGVIPSGALVVETWVTPIDTADDGPDAMANAVTANVGILELSDSTVSDPNYLGAVTDLSSAATTQKLTPTPDGTTHGNNDPLTYDAIITVTTADAAIAENEGFLIQCFYTMP